MSDQAKLGVIGGSGLYQMDALENARPVAVTTPYGDPSDKFIVGNIGDQEVAFLPRHGIGHRILPSELNFRANIYALKKLGCEAVLSVSAVGSLREDIAPGHVVIPDQFIDRTRGRKSTFFGDGVVAHVGFANPFCAPLSQAVIGSAKGAGATTHEGGTYICMEGPLFSTRAESHLYRSWGGNIIGMTNLQEAKLAREAELCFATLALATDYDCWRDEEESVEITDVLSVLQSNAKLAQEIVAGVASQMREARDCRCRSALEHAIITDPAMISEKRLRELSVVAGRVLNKSEGA